MTTPSNSSPRPPRPGRPARPAAGGYVPVPLRLRPVDDPRRGAPKPIGVTNDHSGRREVIGLSVPDARHHIGVQGVTGAGKTTLLTRLALADAAAGRGVVVIDPQGDLVRQILARLPADAAERLVLIDPDETHAPATYNVLDHLTATDAGATDSTAGHAGDGADVARREWAAEQLTGVFSRLSRSWGPRMDDLLRGAALTLAARPGSTLADVGALLTDPGFRRRTLDQVGTTPDGLLGLWDELDRLTPPAQAQLVAPLVSRLRALLSRRFVRDLFAVPATTVDLSAVLDGGILLARLPKGVLGTDVVRLVGSLLLAGLWAHTTRRAERPPDQRPDASVLVDEAQNFAAVPPGFPEILAESRGYRVSWLLAHQHLAQLPPEVAHAVEANARNKLLLSVSDGDARALERHVTPWFDAADLARREAYSLTARLVVAGQDRPPFTLACLPLDPEPPGRADAMRAAARAHGLTTDQRAALRRGPTITGPGPHDRPPPGPDHAGALDVPGQGPPSGPPLGPPPGPPPRAADPLADPHPLIRAGQNPRRTS